MEQIRAAAATELEAAREEGRQQLVAAQQQADVELARVRAEADRLVDDAVLARTRAEGDRDNAQRQAETSAAEITALRTEVGQVRADAYQVQSRLRDEARAEPGGAAGAIW